MGDRGWGFHLKKKTQDKKIKIKSKNYKNQLKWQKICIKYTVQYLLLYFTLSLVKTFYPSNDTTCHVIILQILNFYKEGSEWCVCSLFMSNSFNMDVRYTWHTFTFLIKMSKIWEFFKSVSIFGMIMESASKLVQTSVSLVQWFLR